MLTEGQAASTPPSSPAPNPLVAACASGRCPTTFQFITVCKDPKKLIRIHAVPTHSTVDPFLKCLKGPSAAFPLQESCYSALHWVPPPSPHSFPWHPTAYNREQGPWASVAVPWLHEPAFGARLGGWLLFCIAQYSEHVCARIDQELSRHLCSIGHKPQQIP